MFLHSCATRIGLDFEKMLSLLCCVKWIFRSYLVLSVALLLLTISAPWFDCYFSSIEREKDKSVCFLNWKTRSLFLTFVNSRQILITTCSRGGVAQDQLRDVSSIIDFILHMSSSLPTMPSQAVSQANLWNSGFDRLIWMASYVSCPRVCLSSNMCLV